MKRKRAAKRCSTRDFCPCRTLAPRPPNGPAKLLGPLLGDQAECRSGQVVASRAASAALSSPSALHLPHTLIQNADARRRGEELVFLLPWCRTSKDTAYLPCQLFPSLSRPWYKLPAIIPCTLNLS